MLQYNIDKLIIQYGIFIFDIYLMDHILKMHSYNDILNDILLI